VNDTLTCPACDGDAWRTVSMCSDGCCHENEECTFCDGMGIVTTEHAATFDPDASFWPSDN
jgi:hypothetical protein